MGSHSLTERRPDGNGPCEESAPVQAVCVPVNRRGVADVQIRHLPRLLSDDPAEKGQVSTTVVLFWAGEAYKSIVLMPARGETNMPKEESTVMKVPGALTNLQGCIK